MMMINLNILNRQTVVEQKETVEKGEFDKS